MVLLPSLLSAFYCVKEPLAALVLMVLPLGQIVAWLGTGSVDGLSLIIAADLWIAIIIVSRIAYSPARRRTILPLCASFGVIHAACVFLAYCAMG